MLRLRDVLPAALSSFAAVPAGLGIVAARFQANSGGHMDWPDGGFVVMWIAMAVCWFGVLVLGVWAVSAYVKRVSEAGRSALEIAKARYAHGESRRKNSSRSSRPCDDGRRPGRASFVAARSDMHRQPSWGGSI